MDNLSILQGEQQKQLEFDTPLFKPEAPLHRDFNEQVTSRVAHLRAAESP
jgi:hypothetical protein